MTDDVTAGGESEDTEDGSATARSGRGEASGDDDPPDGDEVDRNAPTGDGTSPSAAVGDGHGSRDGHGVGNDPEEVAITDGPERTRDRGSDHEVLREEIAQLRYEIESLEDGVERRTVKRASLERELKAYVRRRVRRGHARGWGPYLVLLYGTAMTIAAFYFLDGGWAVLAMVVVWTSTLGLYVLMVLFGLAFSALGIPGRIRNRIASIRS